MWLLFWFGCGSTCEEPRFKGLNVYEADEVQRAIDDFTGFSGMQVCVSDVGFDRSLQTSGREMWLHPDQPLYEQSFHRLCTLVDKETEFSLGYPEAFDGVGINTMVFERERERQIEDFARTCERSLSRAPWFHALQEECGLPVAEDDQAIMEFFSRYSLNKVALEEQSSVEAPLFERSNVYLFDDAVAFVATVFSEEQETVITVYNSEQQLLWEERLDEVWDVFSGGTELLLKSHDSSQELLRVTHQGLIPFGVSPVPRPGMEFANFARDAEGWWWLEWSPTAGTLHHLESDEQIEVGPNVVIWSDPYRLYYWERYGSTLMRRGMGERSFPAAGGALNILGVAHETVYARVYGDAHHEMIRWPLESEEWQLVWSACGDDPHPVFSVSPVSVYKHLLKVGEGSDEPDLHTVVRLR